MSLACKDVSGLADAAKKLIQYEKILDDWLNKPPFTNITYNGVSIPSLRTLIATIDERESRAAQEVMEQGIAQIVAIKNHLNELAAQVQADIDKLVAMQVTVEMLPEGANASGTYDGKTGLLSLNIPRGFTGEQGKQGPQGQAPVIDVINCGKAQTSWLTVLDGGQADTYEVANA